MVVQATSSLPLPLAPPGDLRTALVEHLLGLASEQLARAARRRQEAFAGGRWQEYAAAIRQHVRQAFGPMPCGPTGGPLRVRPVSVHETRHCRVENVLFDSFPGWEVNASVFVPYGAGPFPAVVIPVGHSGKQYASYQVPAQAFAALGFVAVLFDPPGQDSEKQRGNDHFRDGVRTFLTGHSANRYFVLDALRCIDYLETRPDVELSAGVGMTGVSGGGHTTLFAVLFDARIACQGPSCCLNRMIDHPVGDLYAACPESMWSGRLAAGVDELDVLLAGIPVPALYMAGAADEVFRLEWSQALAREAAAAYAQAGAADRFRFFVDAGGHEYTLAQVRQFAGWMNRWIRREPDRPVPALAAEDFPPLPRALLRCHPAAEQNMFTLNRAIAAAQRARRASRGPLGAASAAAAVRRVVGTPRPLAGWQETPAVALWSQTYREVLATVEGLPVPATLLAPAAGLARPESPWLVWVDPGGRRAALESAGPAAQLSRMLERDTGDLHPHVLVPDLPGWGESTPALVPYALAGWGSMDRLTAYLSCAVGDAVLALRTRCTAALVDHLHAAFGMPYARLVLAGRGLGGAVALMAAALTPVPLGGLVAWSAPASFQDLAEAESYTWPAAAFLPDVLASFDLPEIARALPVPVAILDPRDAAGTSLAEPAARALFGELPAAGSLLLGPCSASQALAATRSLLARAGT